MSVIKNRQTDFATAPVDVKFRLTQTNIVNIDNKPIVNISAVLRGTFGNTPGEVAKQTTNLGLPDIQEHFTAAEKAATKLVFQAIERVAAGKITDLAGETHDDTDVF